MAFNPYYELGVEQNADLATIRRKYKELCQVWHPDKQPDNPHAKTKFAQIKKAWEILKDPDQRAMWDRGEEPRKVDHRSAAINIIVDHMMQHLSKTGITDVVKGINRRLQVDIREVNKVMKTINEQLDACEEAKKKFKFNGDGLNILAQAIDNHISKGKEELSKSETRLKVLSKAVELIGEYEDVEELMASYFISTGTSSTGGDTWV